MTRGSHQLGSGPWPFAPQKSYRNQDERFFALPPGWWTRRIHPPSEATIRATVQTLQRAYPPNGYFDPHRWRRYRPPAVPVLNGDGTVREWRTFDGQLIALEDDYIDFEKTWRF